MELSVRSSSVADVLSGLRNVPARVVPLAAATALTRSALRARDDVRAAMLSVFDRPTQYTLNSLYVVPANRDTLRARVQVKNQTTRGGNLPENYLFSEVEGGNRNHKRMENALRYAGYLPAGWYAMATRAAAPLLDENGNLPGGTIRRILTACARRGARKKGAEFFAVAPDAARGRRRAGVYQVKPGGGILPVLTFTATRPNYKQRLDFAGIAQRSAEAAFAGEFARALAAQLGRTGGQA